MNYHLARLEIHLQHQRRELLREAQARRLADLLPRVDSREEPRRTPRLPFLNRLELFPAP